MKKFNLKLLLLPIAIFMASQANANSITFDKQAPQQQNELNSACDNEAQCTINNLQKDKKDKTNKKNKKFHKKESYSVEESKMDYIPRFNAVDFEKRIAFWNKKFDINKLSISTVGKKEVLENYLTIELSTKKQNADPKALEKEIVAEVNSAITNLKKMIPSTNTNVKITNGNFYIFPKYERDSSKISIWEGKGSIVIEGKDMTTIKDSISKLKSDLVVSDVSLSVANEDISKYKDEVMNIAIDNFKKEAQNYTKSFGFDDYIIQNVDLGYNNYTVSVMKNAMVMSVRSMAANQDEEYVPTQTLEIMPNKVELQATINGTVVMMKKPEMKKDINKPIKELNQDIKNIKIAK